MFKELEAMYEELYEVVQAQLDCKDRKVWER